VVICTAYSDYSWDEMISKIGKSDRLVILKKPFDVVEVLQLTYALTEKWRLMQQAKHNLQLLEDRVRDRTRKLIAEIAERRRVGKAIRRMEAIVEWSDDAIISETLDGVIASWNLAAEKLFGYSAQEAIGSPTFMLIPPERANEESDILERIKRGECIDHFETVRVRKGGKRIDVSVTISPIKAGHGRVVGVSKIARDITERKRAEEELRVSEERYKTLFEAAAEGILVADIESKQFKYANPAVCRMLGYTAEELTRLGVADIHPKEALDHVVAEFEAQARGEKALAPEIPCLRKDGSVLYADIITAPVVIEGRQCNVGFFTDITGRKRAEAALRQSEERFRLAAESVSDVVYEWEMGSSLQWFGDIDKLLGYAPGEFPRTMEAWVDIVHPEDRDRVRTAVERHLRGEAAYDIEYRVRHKDGTWRHWLARGTVLRDASGKPCRWIGAVTDTTEQKQAEMALRQSEEKHRGLIDNIPDIAWTTDSEGHTIFISPHVKEVYGYTPEEIYADHELWLGRVHPDDIERVMTAFKSLFTEDKMFDVEYRVQRKDGLWIWLHDRSINVYGKDGKRHADGVFADISARKRVELTRLRSLERQERLNQLQQALLAPGELVQKLKTITDGVVDIFGADFCRIWRIRPGDLCERGCMHASVTEGPHACQHRDKCLQLLASSGRYTHTDGAAHRRVPFGAYKIGRVASGQEHEFLTNDMVNDPRVHNHDWAKGLGLVSFAGYQLRPLGGETLGVLALFSKHAITPEEDAQLDALSGTTAQVIHAAQAEEALRESEGKYRALFENTRDAIMTLEPPAWKFTSGNPATIKMFGAKNEEEFVSLGLGELSPERQPDGRPSAEKAGEMIETAMREGSHFFEWTHRRIGGEEFPADVLLTRMDRDGKVILQATARDITERKRTEQDRATLEVQLRHAQKLEAIGQLAAGIAHEINTPTQYISDNTRFVQEAFRDVKPAIEQCHRLLEAVKQNAVTEQMVREVEEAMQTADLDYLLAEVPKAVQQSLDGLHRVAKIVQAMKEFSHPGSESKTAVDLNRAIESTITVARNEWKYVAELVTDFDPELPPVPCLPGEFNQVILNVLINAAHAIADVVGHGENGKGKITVSTRRVGDSVEVRISDTGTGIPEAVRSKIFEPFFTTKSVGKGSGQGLAIARSVVVGKHGGSLTFETEMGQGTTFIIRLPLGAEASAG
jgi:PAS domain S-box-containing protein